MAQFNTLPPSIEPTATGHIVEQIEMVKSILENGHAYVVNGSVYFDVNQFNSDGNVYGDLSGRAVAVIENLNSKLISLKVSSWNSGLYIVKVVTSIGTSIVPFEKLGP